MLCRPLIFASLATFATAGEKTTYDDDVFAIFQQTCLNCHNPDKLKGGLDLSTFASVLKGGSGGKIVEPGDTSSALIAALLPGAEKPMPPEGEKLPADKIEILKRWIEGGLLENNSSSARKPTKQKFETSLRSDPAAKPNGPLPMPVDLLLEPPVVTSRAAAIHAIATSPWSPLLAVTGQRQVLLFHTKSTELIGILLFPEGDPISLAFTSNARFLIVGGGVPGKSGVTVTFDITTGERLLTAAKEFDSVLASDIRPSLDLVATGGPSRLLKIWSTDSGELVKSVKKHTDWITALDLSPDGVLLASGDRNGGVWVWESETASEFHTLRGHQAAITATSFRSDSNLLATASEDGSIRFWEMNGGSEVKKIDAHSGGVTAFAFASDGSSISAGRDRQAKLWKPDFNAARDIAHKLPALPTAVAIDSTEKRAFVADSAGTIRIYHTDDGKPLGEIHANPPTIQTRLDHLATLISSRTQELHIAEKLQTNHTANRDAARNGLTELEKSRQQTQEIQNPAAQAHLSAIDQTLPAARKALESAEKSLADSLAAAQSAKAALATQTAAAKHWSAAAIQAKAIAARAEADKLAFALEDTQLDFTQAATRIAALTDSLNQQRAAREKSPSALEDRIQNDLQALQKAETELLAIREAAEKLATLTHETAVQATTLRESYRQALK